MKRATKIAPTFGYSTLQNCVIEAIENRMQRRIPFISGRIAFPLRLGMERRMQAFTTAIPEDPSKELFIKRCTELIERRGHRFIRVGEKRINHEGRKCLISPTGGRSSTTADAAFQTTRSGLLT